MAGRPKPMNTERLAFHRSRCQARFRSEPWADSFTFTEWWQLWRPLWHTRGRGLRDTVMLRLDHSRPWQPDNVVICERWEYLTPRGLYWRGGRGRNRNRQP